MTRVLSYVTGENAAIVLAGLAVVVVMFARALGAYDQ